MAFRRLKLILCTAACVLVAYLCANLTLFLVMEPVARWVETERKGYLWWEQEWLQLFTPTNFVDRGEGRILLCGSSEAREAFLFDVFDAELHPLKAYQNSYNQTGIQSLMLNLRYIEKVYGSTAMPDKLVLGVEPKLVFDHPPMLRSRHPIAIDRYSPYVRVERDSHPPRFVQKGWVDSSVSWFRHRLMQPRRYRAALRAVFRDIVLDLRPDMAEQSWFNTGLVPSKYHHMPRRPNKQWQIDHLMNVRPPIPRDAIGKADAIRANFGALVEFTTRNEIDLYVINLPLDSWFRDEFFAESYDDYLLQLRIAVGDTPFLDLGRFLADDELYDLVHPNLGGARRVSLRVAQFVRESDENISVDRDN